LSELPRPLEELAAALARLPGVGRRSAQRIAFHLARASKSEADHLARQITGLREALRICEICGHLSEKERCAICSDARRDSSTICVVEQAENLFAIERTGAFRGTYHVLGGAISPLRSIGPDDLRVDELLARVETGDVREVVLATNPTVEGEATALFLARLLRARGIAVTRPATGLPVGGDLEYVDGVTLGRAFEARRDVLDEDAGE
jgi:recombination protein RecR